MAGRRLASVKSSPQSSNHSPPVHPDALWTVKQDGATHSGTSTPSERPPIAAGMSFSHSPMRQIYSPLTASAPVSGQRASPRKTRPLFHVSAPNVEYPGRPASLSPPAVIGENEPLIKIRNRHPSGTEAIGRASLDHLCLHRPCLGLPGRPDSGQQPTEMGADSKSDKPSSSVNQEISAR